MNKIDETPQQEAKLERIAKVIARAGICSRRDAEKLIAQGKVKLNGKILDTPAVTVSATDKIVVNDKPLPTVEATRLWLYHKPRGLVTSHKDEKGRTNLFEKLPEELPRVISVGRLDINTEGLLLLTNDGGLARTLELPKTGWLRRYRVRAYGTITQGRLDKLAKGITVDGVDYGPIEATLERAQGNNQWLTLSLREGKNREIKHVLEEIGLKVNRLIRTSFGPFQLTGIAPGAVKEIRAKVLREQLGKKMGDEKPQSRDHKAHKDRGPKKRGKPDANRRRRS